MNDEMRRIMDDLMQAMPDGGPDWTTEVRVTPAYRERMRRSAEPVISPGVQVGSMFGIPVVVDESIPEDPGFRVVHDPDRPRVPLR